MSLQAKCMSCAKLFTLEPSDRQYRKLITKQSKLYVCPGCSKALKEDAVQSTGIRPELLDPDGFDKRVR